MGENRRGGLFWGALSTRLQTKNSTAISFNNVPGGKGIALEFNDAPDKWYCDEVWPRTRENGIATQFKKISDKSGPSTGLNRVPDKKYSCGVLQRPGQKMVLEFNNISGEK